MAMERTFVMLKPDAVQRGHAGEIISRFEKKGIKMVGMKLMLISEDLASRHYGEHVGKPFYEKLMSYITSGPVVAMVLEGDNAVEMVRKFLGATNPQDATPGTIRCDYGQMIGRNIIHGSDSLASAEREIGLFFDDDELVDYTRIDAAWLFE